MQHVVTERVQWDVVTGGKLNGRVGIAQLGGVGQDDLSDG